MPFLTLDSFDLVAPWAALTPGLAPSGLISLAAEVVGHPKAVNPASLRASIIGAATGHRIRRAVPAVDLSNFGRLEFWFQSNMALHGLSSDPLRLQLRLGSAALGLDAPGNLWGRYLVGQTAKGWSFATISLDDLPAAICSGVSQIEFVVAATDGGTHWLGLDAMLAAAPRMTEDVDQALLQRMDGGLLLGGSPVPARLAPATTAQPYFRATQFGAKRARERDPVGFRRHERDDLGLISWPAPQAWDLSYRIDPVAATRAELAAMLDYIQARFDTGCLPVGNRVFRIEKVDAVWEGDVALSLPPLRYVVSAWAETGSPSREAPVLISTMLFDIQPAGA
jgi:hypothetical protein